MRQGAADVVDMLVRDHDLIKRTHGILNTASYEAAVDGLARAKDPRAIEPLFA